jgi:hypothetical protein
MDYYSKYKKYKLKFLNIRKQIGGAIIWQFEVNPGTNIWVDYSAEESQIIERNSGTFQLPSRYMINKVANAYVGKQYGKPNAVTGIRSERNIRKIPTLLATQIFHTIQRFPQILTFNTYLPTFRNTLIHIFAMNKEEMDNIWGGRNSWEMTPREHEELFRTVINEIKGIFNQMSPDKCLSFIQAIMDKISSDALRERNEREARGAIEEEKYDEGDDYGNGMYGR